MPKTNNHILDKLLPLKSPKVFSTPENYMDGILGNVQERIAVRNTSKAHVINRVLKPAMSLAFYCLAFLFIGYVAYKVLKPYMGSRNIVKQDELVAYLEDNAAEMEEYLIYGELSQYKTTVVTATQANDTINYLINAGLDDTEILNNL